MSIFKKYSYWINSGKYTAIQKFAVLGFGIVSFMMLTRIMGTADYGVWGLFITISGITETARTALLKNAFIRFMNQTPEEEHGRLQSATLVLNLSTSCGLALIYLLSAYAVAHWLEAPGLASMLQWYALTLVVSVVFSQSEMLLNAKMDFRGICWMYCVRQGLLVAGIGVFVIAHWPISPGILSFFYMITMLAGSITGGMFALKYVQWNFHGYRPWIGKIWRFGRNVFGNNACSLLFRSTDNFMTSHFLGTAISGYYNACLRISNLVDLPSQVLGDVLFPKAAKFNSTDKGAIRHAYERTVGAILVFSMPSLIVLFLFPSLILHLLAGGKYLAAVRILQITAFFGFTLPFMKQFGTIMDATGHPNLNFRVMFLALCVDIVANYTGIRLFGVIGAALGTATTYFVILIVSQIILNRMFGVSFLRCFTNAFSLYKELFAQGKTFLKLSKA